MKKILSIILCLVMVLCFASCNGANEKKDSYTYTAYEAGKHTVQLPNTYEYNDLVEVKAEPDCVAMLTDKEGKLPDLWIYEDDCECSNLKEHIFSMDSVWNFKELSIYSNEENEVVANTVFDEDWYGEALINEGYYKLVDGKVFWFDFAYSKDADQAAMHSYIVEIAENLGF